jgi:hypothetical protein
LSTIAAQTPENFAGAGDAFQPQSILQACWASKKHLKAWEFGVARTRG